MVYQKTKKKINEFICSTTSFWFRIDSFLVELNITINHGVNEQSTPLYLDLFTGSYLDNQNIIFQVNIKNPKFLIHIFLTKKNTHTKKKNRI